MRTKFAEEDATKQKEIDDKKKEELKKQQADERGILLTGLQSRLEDLDAQNQLVEFDFEQDLIRLGEQRQILAEQERTELANTELTEFNKTEIRKKYADARKDITNQEIATEKAANAAKHEINMAYLGLFQQFGSVLSQVAGKNKALAIAGVIIQQAASIGQIIASTGIANAKAVAASPLTFGMPWVAINTVSAGLSIAASVAGAVKSISEINKAASQAGVQGGGGGSEVIGGRGSASPFWWLLMGSQLGRGSGGGFGNLMTTDPTSFGDGYSSAGFGGGNFTTSDPNSFADGYSSSGWKDPNQGFDYQGYGKQIAKQLLSQKQGGMGGGMGGNQQNYQYQPQPIQRQAAFAATPATFQVQDKPTDIAALVAALRGKGAI
jgi:hypothetical protein